MSNKEILNKIVPIAAIIMATVAVVISILQGCETRKHNRLSVTPILNIYTIEPEMTSTKLDKTFGLFMVNNGTGPAIINKVSLFVDGVFMEGEKNGWPEALLNENLILDENWIRYYSLDNGSAIRPGQTVKLLYNIPELSNIELLTRLANTLSKLHYKVDYKSIYKEEEFTANSK